MAGKLADRDDIVYHRCYENKAYGHAIYKELSAADMKPGTVGYFNLGGTWVPIVHLTDEGTFTLDPNTNEETCPKYPKLKSIKNINKKEEKEGPWDAIVSEGVEGKEADLSLSGKAPDGSGGGLKFTYTSSKEESAILLTEGKITHCQVPREIDRLRAWMFENLPEILKVSGDMEAIKKKGLWIITETYSAQRAAIALLRSKNSEISFGISAAAYGAEASPSAAWWNGKKESSWKVLCKEELPPPETQNQPKNKKHNQKHAPKVAAAPKPPPSPAEQEKIRVVLFMSGIQYRPSRNFLSKEWKSYEDAREQKHLGSTSKPVPVGVELPVTGADQQAGTERIIFRPYAGGKDKNLSHLPKPKTKESPFEDVEDEIESESEEEHEEDDF